MDTKKYTPKIGDKFRALVDYCHLKKGEILTLTSLQEMPMSPVFSNDEGSTGSMYFNTPGKADEVEPLEQPAPLTLDSMEKLYTAALKYEDIKSDYHFEPLDQRVPMQASPEDYFSRMYEAKWPTDEPNRKEDKPMSNFITLTDEQKAHMDAESQALYRAGVISSDFTIGSTSEFLNRLLKLNYSTLAKQVQGEIDAEEAREAAKAKKAK